MVYFSNVKFLLAEFQTKNQKNCVFRNEIVVVVILKSNMVDLAQNDSINDFDKCISNTVFGLNRRTDGRLINPNSNPNKIFDEP